MNNMSLGLKDALRLTLDGIRPLPAEKVDLVDGVDRIVATDLYALVDSPSTDASLKDGYAVLSGEVGDATKENPVRLHLLGSMAAGGEAEIQVEPGATVRVLTGARIPTGADAVVAEEFVKLAGNDVLVEIFAEPGRNILRRGSDVAMRKRIVHAGRQITPGMTGLLAAAGHSMIPVFRNPVVGILGTGDEIVEPGKPLADGELYASNIVTLAGWCTRYRMKTRMAIVKDDRDALLSAIEVIFHETDALLTSGGAWTGDRDLMAQVLDELGWKQVFHRIRIGPGKAVGFGTLGEKPVFILPGGPSSNLMGFLQIALPGLLALSGHANPGLPGVNARLAVDLRKRVRDWTDFIFGTLEEGEGLATFVPSRRRSRLGSIAEATALASIPEGQDCLPAGSTIYVQLLN